MINNNLKTGGNLEHRESKRASANAHDVVVHSRDNELVVLFLAVTDVVLQGSTAGYWGRARGGVHETSVGSDSTRGVVAVRVQVVLNSSLGWVDVQGNVGQLTVVGRSHWVQVEEVQGVRVHVVTGLVWDGWGLVVRLNKGVEVRTHVSKTVGVLVEQGSSCDRIVRTSGGHKSTTLSPVDAVKDREGW